jgi:DNA 3'-phosphatase
MEFRYDVINAIRVLAPKALFIVSNQGGIEKGLVDRVDFEIKFKYILASINEYTKVFIVDGLYTPANDEDNPYRKPNTGLLSTILNRYKYKLFVDNIINDIDKDKSEYLMIGDASGKEGQFSDSDKKTAENFGIDYMDVDEFVLNVIAGVEKGK